MARGRGQGVRSAGGEAAGAAWRSALRRLLAGTSCAICRSWQDEAFCADCRQRFGRPRVRCVRCAIGLATPMADLGAEAGAPRRPWACASCLREPPPQLASVAAHDYAYPWDGLLGRLKFHEGLELARPLALALARAVERQRAVWPAPGVDGAEAGLARSVPPAELVVPVPLAPQRLRERGYNQAWELARRVAAELGLPCSAQALVRLRDTPHQLDLPRERRAANVARAFAPADPAALQGRHVALVDDVMTTGHTLAEAGRALLRGGAASVQCWVVARTPPPDEA